MTPEELEALKQKEEETKEEKNGTEEAEEENEENEEVKKNEAEVHDPVAASGSKEEAEEVGGKDEGNTSAKDCSKEKGNDHDTKK